MRLDERGLSGSVQVTLLFPLVLGVFLLGLQWAMLTWAQTTVQAAAEDGARAGAALGAGDSQGHDAAHVAADNGSLSAFDISIARQASRVTATVRGTAVGVLPFFPVDVEATAITPVEAIR